MLVVNLIRQPSGFGFRLYGGHDLGIPLLVGSIVPGGSASLDGRLHENDEIVEIDGHRVDGARHDHAVDLIKRAGEVGHVKLVVRRPFSAANGTTSGHSHHHHNGENYEQPKSTTSTATTTLPTSASASSISVATPPPPYDVQLSKLDKEEFGCTIVTRNHRYISEILPGSPAMRCGRLQIGDCVIAINGVSTYNMNHMQIMNCIKSSGTAIVFTIDPANRMPTLATFDEPDTLSTVTIHSQSRHSSQPPTNHQTTADPNAIYGTVRSRRAATEAPPSNDVATMLVVVELVRGPKGFGFSIRGGWEFEKMPIFILRIAEDGPAAVSQMRIGDQLVEINTESTDRMTHERAIKLIKDRKTVRLLLRRQQAI